MLKHSQNNFIPFLFACLFLSCSQQETTIIDKDNPKVDSILSFYNVLLHAGQHKRAIKYLDSANHTLTYASKANLWKIYRDKHLYYLDFQRNLTKSNTYLDSMELILRKSSLAYPNEYVQTSFARGDLFFTEKKYTEAFKSYYDGRQFAIKNLDSCRLSEFTSQLAHIKFRQLKFADAIAYLKISLIESEACNSGNNFHNRFVTIQSKFNTIGVAYTKYKMP